MALSGEPIDARRAEAIGLVNRVVSPSQLTSVADSVAAASLALSADSIAAIKDVMDPSKTWSDAAASHHFQECLKTEIAQSSIQRFRKNMRMPRTLK